MPIGKSLTSSNPNGMTNARLEGTLAAAGFPDPSYGNIDFDDFNRFLASDWTVTKVGTGTDVQQAGIGGQLLLTTTAGAADSVLFQRPFATQQLLAGKQAFFKIYMAMSDVINTAFNVGFLNTTTTPLAPTDGIYIGKAAGSAALTLNSMVGSVLTSTPFPAVEVPVNNTFFELGLQVDWLGNLLGYFNPLTGTQLILNAIASNQARGRVVQLLNQQITGGLTAANLNMSFGLTNAAAAAKTMTVDYVLAACER